MWPLILDLLIYFAVGIIQDFFLTLNWRYVAKEKVIPAVTFSFLTTVVSLLVFYDILTGLDAERGIIAIVVYSLGIGTGTFLAMKFKTGLND